MGVVRFDVCGPYPVFLGAVSGYGPIPEQDFQMSNSLTSAALNTSLPVCDYQGNTGCFNIQIHLVWQGTGGMIANQARESHYDEGGCRFFGTLGGQYRQGSASGTLASATTAYISGTSLEAYLSSGWTSSMVLQCDNPQ
jgi:hypothetical protein